MRSEIIYSEAVPHVCDIGKDHDATDYAVGSIAQCECGRNFKCRNLDTPFGLYQGWTPVYWWNFKARKLIERHEAWNAKPSEESL